MVNVKNFVGDVGEELCGGNGLPKGKPLLVVLPAVAVNNLLYTGRLPVQVTQEVPAWESLLVLGCNGKSAKLAHSLRGAREEVRELRIIIRANGFGRSNLLSPPSTAIYIYL